MKILIVTDAWKPQVNGVVRTLEKLAEVLAGKGIETEFLSPDGFRTLPLPSYPEIRLALATPGAIARRIEQAAPDSIHIATEGVLGILARPARSAGQSRPGAQGQGGFPDSSAMAGCGNRPG